MRGCQPTRDDVSKLMLILEGYLEGYQRTASPRPEEELLPIATGLRHGGDLVKKTL